MEELKNNTNVSEKSNDNSETIIDSEEDESVDTSSESNKNNRKEVLNTILDTIQDLDDVKEKLSDEEYLKIANKLQFIYNKCKYITNFDSDDDWSSDDEEESEAEPLPPHVCNCSYENFGNDIFACYNNKKSLTPEEYIKCNRYKMLCSIIPDLKFFYHKFDKRIIVKEGDYFIPHTYDSLTKHDCYYIYVLIMKMKEFGYSNEIGNNDNTSFLIKIISEYLLLFNSFNNESKAYFSIYCINFTINILKYFTNDCIRLAYTIEKKIEYFLNNIIYIEVYEYGFNGKENDFIKDWTKYIKYFIESKKNFVVEKSNSI